LVYVSEKCNLFCKVCQIKNLNKLDRYIFLSSLDPTWLGFCLYRWA
jgi:hypothetical protein